MNKSKHLKILCQKSFFLAALVQTSHITGRNRAIYLGNSPQGEMAVIELNSCRKPPICQSSLYFSPHEESDVFGSINQWSSNIQMK